MPAFPRGIVTFLFTDIEGSTRLWERDPELMWAALERHNTITGRAISDNCGVHFKTIGDAYQAAFADPADALRAAVDAQRRLAAEPWEGTGPIRVRMALHLGPAEPSGGDYLAPCLNRLSRLLSTGYGAQVLISDLVRRRVERSLPDGVTLLDLGQHRLRDLLEPERVSQVVIEGLPATFPPLKSLERHPTNLPIQPNALVGRERELEAIARMLGQGDTRLVTLTGIGGTGKTRLALQAGAEMLDACVDGVFFVDLAPVASPDLVIPTIAATLGVRESGDLPVTDALVSYLDGKQLLLILDNFEHLQDAARDVAMLLERCERIQLLVTSRARLNVRAEREIVIPPLEVPQTGRPPEEIAASDAVSLFVQRAASVSPGFALTDENAGTVAAICARLDGLPLAIELAAARVKTLSPGALLERLDRRLELLTTGAHDLPARQRTLRAAIEWSHDLLPAPSRDLFDRLAVFSGGFDLDAARAVAGDGSADTFDVLTALVDRSLLRSAPEHDDAPRFTMLETLREFGLERLERGGIIEQVRDAHAAWCLELAEEANGKLAGPEQSAWLARLALEHDNLRGALAWTDTLARRDTHRRLVAAMGRFWLIQGHFTEGRRWTDGVLANDDQEPMTRIGIQLMNNAGNLTFAQGDFTGARRRYETALEGALALGDKRLQAAMHNNLGNVAMRFVDPTQAQPNYERALQIGAELGDDFMRANALGNLGGIAHARGDVDGALARYTECLSLWRKLGNAHGEVPILLNLQLLLAPLPEHAERARQFGERCLAAARKLGDRWNEALALMGMGQIDDARENLDCALAWYEKSLAILRSLGTQEWIRSLVGYIAVVVLDQGDIERGITMLLEKLDTDTERDALEVTLEELAVALLYRGEPHIAAKAIGAAQGIRDNLHFPVQSQCKRRHDRSIAELQVQLGPLLEPAMMEGRRATIDDLIIEIRHALRAPSTPEPATPRERLFADLDVLMTEPLPPTA